LNRQIVHVFGLLTLLFAVLVVFTSRWAVWEAEALEDHRANRRPLLQEQRVPRGLILARDGTRLAQSRPVGTGERRTFVRFYPPGPLFAHAVGYSFVERGRAGLEQSRNEELTGGGSEFKSLIDELGRGEREGDDIVTTLDPAAQRTAIQALGGRRGSIVALEPQTGRVRVMVSEPSYDPNEVPRRFDQLNRQESSPIFNRATQARYPPGSTFKVVTAAAALDTGRYTAGSVVSGQNGKPISGVPLQNFGGQSFGSVSLTEALTNSVNTVWGEVGQRLGPATMYRYMDRFGFGDEPQVDYPRQQLTPSGVFGRRGLLDRDDPVDMGRVAIGQERLQVTPLQMAMVTAAIANRGKLMKPRLVERIQARDGRIKDRIGSDKAADVMESDSAGALAGMMTQVVKEGSGTAAALIGTPVAGKTGTAEVAGGSANQAWFIGFAPVRDPKMAVAVTVERTQGTGGEVAGPLAKTVLERLLRNG
jgi:peptidoglycan glycosyltransferase